MNTNKMKMRRYFKYLRRIPYHKKIIRINPFYNKRTGHYFIPILYFLNKIFCMDLKLVPYSSKVGKISDNINKCLIHSIKYEIRLCLLSFFIIIVTYNFIHFIAPNIKEIIYYMNITLCALILYLVYRVLKRIFITGKMHCDTNSIPTEFSQTQDKVQDKEKI